MLLLTFMHDLYLAILVLTKLVQDNALSIDLHLHGHLDAHCLIKLLLLLLEFE